MSKSCFICGCKNNVDAEHVKSCIEKKRIEDEEKIRKICVGCTVTNSSKPELNGEWWPDSFIISRLSKADNPKRTLSTETYGDKFWHYRDRGITWNHDVKSKKKAQNGTHKVTFSDGSTMTITKNKDHDAALAKKYRSWENVKSIKSMNGFLLVNLNSGRWEVCDIVSIAMVNEFGVIYVYIPSKKKVEMFHLSSKSISFSFTVARKEALERHRERMKNWKPQLFNRVDFKCNGKWKFGRVLEKKHKILEIAEILEDGTLGDIHSVKNNGRNIKFAYTNAAPQYGPGKCVKIGIPPNGFGIIINETESEYEIVKLRVIYGPSTKQKFFKWAVSPEQPSKKVLLESVFRHSITRTSDQRIGTIAANEAVTKDKFVEFAIRKDDLSLHRMMVNVRTSKNSRIQSKSMSLHQMRFTFFPELPQRQLLYSQYTNIVKTLFALESLIIHNCTDKARDLWNSSPEVQPYAMFYRNYDRGTHLIFNAFSHNVPGLAWEMLFHKDLQFSTHVAKLGFHEGWHIGIWVAMEGGVELLQRFLDTFWITRDITKIVDEDKNSLLHFAISWGDNELLNFLKKFPKLIEHRNSEGTSPLGLAASLGNVEACAVLLSRGASPLAQSTDEDFPMQIAFQGESMKKDVLKIFYEECYREVKLKKWKDQVDSEGVRFGDQLAAFQKNFNETSVLN